MRRSAASVELDELEQLVGARRRLARREVEQPPLEDEQLAPGLPRVEPGLLQRDADPAAHGVGLAGDVDAGDPRAAGGDREQRRQHPHRRRLAGAVRPEEAEHLARLDPQVDAAHRLDRLGTASIRLHQTVRFHRGIDVHAHPPFARFPLRRRPAGKVIANASEGGDRTSSHRDDAAAGDPRKRPRDVARIG